jgi:hypothetical protein
LSREIVLESDLMTRDVVEVGACVKVERDPRSVILYTAADKPWLLDLKRDPPEFQICISVSTDREAASE